MYIEIQYFVALLFSTPVLYRITVNLQHEIASVWWFFNVHVYHRTEYM